MNHRAWCGAILGLAMIAGCGGETAREDAQVRRPFDGGAVVEAPDAGRVDRLDAGQPAVDAPLEDAAVDSGLARDAAFPPPQAHGCVTQPRWGKRTVACGEITHELSVPSRCLHEACGVILDVHGGTMSGPLEEKNTRLAERGAEYGYIVIQPSAATRVERNVLPQWVPELDDEPVMEFVGDVIAAFHADPDRVHVTGFSQGSLMTWRLICAHGEFFASAAPASGTHPDDAEEDCSFEGADRPSVEIPILAMHGTLDPISLIEEGLRKRDAVRGAFEMGEGVVVAQGDRYTHTRYTNPRGVVFEFVQHEYRTDAEASLPPFWHQELEGHCYPGSDDLERTLPGQVMPFACTPPNAFEWGDLVLRFFQAHPRR